MLYLATASGSSVTEAMAEGLLGQMVTYKAGNRLAGSAFAIDNGVVKLAGGRPITDPAWSPERWQATLDRYAGVPGCIFAVVPDAVADTEETDRRWRRWAPAVSRRGYRAAYVAQDGCRRIPLLAEAVFLGGSDEFKLGAEGRAIAEAAKASGRWLHVGRVNTLGRLRYAAHDLGADSVDGTMLAYGPDHNLRRLLRWLEGLDRQQALTFGGSTAAPPGCKR